MKEVNALYFWQFSMQNSQMTMHQVEKKIAKFVELEWLFYECVVNYVFKNMFSSTQKFLLMEGTRDMCIWTKCNKIKECYMKCMHQRNTMQTNNWINTKIGEEE